MRRSASSRRSLIDGAYVDLLARQDIRAGQAETIG